MKTRLIDGFFVSRHLGLVGCNIVLMKRFLPLFILTGLLFGQESTIVLKDGKTIKGTIVSEEEYEYTVQVVKVYGYSRYEKIKILKSDIVTIESEINTTQEEDKGTNIDSDRQKLFVQDVLLHKSGEVYKGIYIGKVDEDIIFKLEGEKSNSAFSINDVDIVITSRGGIKVELYYPFDIETKIEEDNSGFWKRASEAYVTGNQDEFLRQNTNPSPNKFFRITCCLTLLFLIVLVENPYLGGV